MINSPAVFADRLAEDDLIEALRQRQENIEHYKNAVEQDPSSSLAHYNLGVAYGEAGRYPEEIEAYLLALQIASDYIEARYNLGIAYFNNRDFASASSEFEKLISQQSDFAPAYFMLGAVHAQLKDFDESISATRQGLQYAPEDPGAYFNIGNSYFHLYQYEKAIEYFRRTIEKDETAAQAFYMIGKCYREMGKRKEEFNAYLDAVKIVPDFADALFALGTVWAHLNGGEKGEKIPFFETGGTVEVNNPTIYFYLGLANLAMGDTELARKQQEDLRELNQYLADKLEYFINFEENNVCAKKSQDETKSKTKETESKAQKTSKKRQVISIDINDNTIEAKNIPELYKKALKYLVDNRWLEKVSLPIATGEKRYILANEPIHPTGKPFLAPVEYAGFFMEAHNNRTAAMGQLKKLVKSVGCTFGEIFEFDNGMDNEPETLALDPEKLSKFQGCLLGGAVGDALGAAIEFNSIDQIRRQFGANGLTYYAPAYGRIGAITDDTQMTLFTAEGLLRAVTRLSHRGICGVAGVIFHAYLRWLHTQGEESENKEIDDFVQDESSWLFKLAVLNSRRAPGNSCLSALRSGKMGTIENPINNSKGCGGVMRVAPIGLIAIDPFGLASETAAITHGHPTGYLSAGVLALIINKIIKGKSLAEAINYSVYEILPQHANYEETLAACDKAIKLANDKTVRPSPETVETLGSGWVAEEALAIAIYCSLVYENNFTKAILCAVNHSGDSDSTGAITGNILGSIYGISAIPEIWLDRLELKETIMEIASDLLIGFHTNNDWSNKYPGF